MDYRKRNFSEILYFPDSCSFHNHFHHSDSKWAIYRNTIRLSIVAATAETIRGTTYSAILHIRFMRFCRSAIVRFFLLNIFPYLLSIVEFFSTFRVKKYECISVGGISNAEIAFSISSCPHSTLLFNLLLTETSESPIIPAKAD